MMKKEKKTNSCRKVVKMRNLAILRGKRARYQIDYRLQPSSGLKKS